MPITTTCPGCNSLFRLPDEMAGAQVRCQKCEQLFMVPGAIPTTTATAEEAPVEATLAPPAQDDIVMATLSEPTDEKPASVPKPPPLPKKPLTVDQPASVFATLSLLLLFVIGLFVTGAGAAFWVAFHLAPPIRVTAAPPLHAVHQPMPNMQVGINKKDDFILIGKEKDWKKADKDWDIKRKDDDFLVKKVNPAVPTPIQFGGIDGGAIRNDRTDNPPFLDHGKWNQDGPYRLYRISLKEGTNYHFFVQGLGNEPRLRIIDGDNVIAEDRRGTDPHDRVMIAYQPQRSGEFLLWVTNKERVSGAFNLIAAPESKVNPIQVDLTVQERYLDNGVLRVKDSLDPGGGQFGPYRDYQVTLEKNREYRVALTNGTFPPALRIDDNQAVVQIPPNQFARRVEQFVRSDNNGKLRVRVTSEHFGIGAYTLTIEPKLVVVTPQRIIASLDDARAYVDQRAFTPGDPVMQGRGSYKDYFLNFEQGKKYKIEWSQGNHPVALLLYAPNDGQAENVMDAKSLVMLHRAAQTGTYRLRVFAPLQKERTEYTLRITTEPQ